MKSKKLYLVRLLGISCGLLADYFYREPPERIHPLVAFAKLQNKLEKVLYARSETAGAIYLAFGVGVSYIAASVGRKALSIFLHPSKRQSPFTCNADTAVDFLTTAGATALTVGVATLWDIAGKIEKHIASDNLIDARKELSKLVGRDTDSLDAKEITRAVIESVAENTVDAVLAPVFFGFLGGEKLSFVYRAVNTLDAMVGYKNERYRHFGFASAKCDDVANYIPARLGAFLIMVTSLRQCITIGSAVRKYAKAHPSPNGGVIETAFASRLGIKLGGVNYYNAIPEHRPVLGDGAEVQSIDITRAILLSKKIVICEIIFLLVCVPVL